MKAITIFQPFASLIATGAKRIETRGWPTKYRGELAIHAGKTTPAWVAELMSEPSELREICAKYLGWGGIDGRSLHDMPTGVIVATCELANCIEIGPSPQRICTVCKGYLAACGHTNRHTEQGVPPICGVEDEHILGDFTPGRFAWMLTNIKPLPEPIPAKGKQGIWEWER